MKKSGDVLKLDQAHLETVLPPIGGTAMIVNGGYRGDTATILKFNTEAFSADGGLTWEDIRPSEIEASGSPGQLQRLQSRRLVLLWNRFIDKDFRTRTGAFKPKQ